MQSRFTKEAFTESPNTPQLNCFIYQDVLDCWRQSQMRSTLCQPSLPMKLLVWLLFCISSHSMQPNANTYVLEFMKLLALQACQSETFSKFTIDTFTPHSAWFSLTFTALKQVTETPEFILLADTYTKDITEFQQLTKSRVVAVAELELFGYTMCHHQVDCWLHCISCQGFCYFWWQNKITGTTIDPPLHLHCSLS